MGDWTGTSYGAGAGRGPETSAAQGRRWAGMSESVALSRRVTETQPITRVRGSVDEGGWEAGEGPPRLQPRSSGRGLTLPGLQERLDRVWEPRVYRSDYTKQELKLPKPFTGESRDGGPNLRAFWHDVRSMMVMWEENHWELRQFFLRMGPLMAGSAKEAYVELAEPLMRQGDTDLNGQPLLDERGRPVPLQDPVSHFFAELERRYPVSLREKSKEFFNFRRKHEEAPHACAARMKDLIQVLGMPDGPPVVSHFLAAWPEWSERAAELLGKRPGVPATLDGAAQALVILTGPVEALKQSMFRSPYPIRQREERARTGGGNGATGYRAESGEAGSRERPNQRCYNCQQPGHLARNCTEPPRDRWVDRPSQTGGTDAEDTELSTAELSRRMRRLQAELRRRRDAEGGNAKLAVVQSTGDGDDQQIWGEEGEEPLPGDWEEDACEDEDEGWASGSVAHVAWEMISEARDGAADPAMMGLVLPREREELGLRSAGEMKPVKPLREEGRAPQASPDTYYTVRQDPLPSALQLQRRWEKEIGIVKLPNQERVLTIEGLNPRVVIVDTGANRMILGRSMREQLGRKARPGKAPGARLGMAEGTKAVMATEHVLETVLLGGTPYEVRMQFRYLLTDSDAYDVLVGTPLWHRLGARVCFWRSTLAVRPYFFCRERCGLMVEVPIQLVEKRAELRDMGLLGRESGDPECKIMRGEIRSADPEEGVVLLDLFAGMGTALAAALQAGHRVKKWIMVEPLRKCREAAKHMAHRMRQQYPQALTTQVIEQADRWGPQDIRLWSPELIEAVGKVHLVVAGWECQGHSRAGKGEGLKDPRSGLFWELVRVLDEVAKTSPGACVVVENVAGEEEGNERQREDWQVILQYLGQPAVLDAVSFGSYAHRVRAYWCNRVSATVLQERAALLTWPTGRELKDILPEGRWPRRVVVPDSSYQVACNVVGEPRRVLPTLMATADSYAFRLQGGIPGAGMIYDEGEERWTEPTAEEREQAMGFAKGDTAARGLTEAERRRILGNAMDLNTLTWVLKQAQEQAGEPEGEGPDPLACAMTAVWGSQTGAAEATGTSVATQQAAAQAGTCVREEKKSKTEGTAEEWTVNGSLAEEVKVAWKQMLEEHRGAFAFTLEQLGRYRGGEVSFRLQLTSEEPIRQRKRRWSPDHQAAAMVKCQELLAAGLIRRSESPYAAATVMAKKTDLLGNVGALRMCGDYRDLNKVTVRDSYPMPTPDEIFDRLQQASWFSTLDLRQGFNQIVLAEADRPKTAFHGPDGLYEWNVMPFGLRNASACFQRVMASVLRGFEKAECFIDDVVVFSGSEGGHRADVAEVLRRIQAAGLTCHPKKCVFAFGSIPYLGLQVGGGQLMVQDAKVAVLKDMPAPKDLARLRTFLGFVGYYRKFIKDFAAVAKPLTLLLRADEQWRWEEPQQEAFIALKERLQGAPVLALHDAKAQLILYTDWSAIGMGAVLSQSRGTTAEQVIAFASRSCNEHERNYSSYEGEGAAAVWAVQHFRIYLQGRPFTLVTDHQPLKWLMQSRDLRGKYARWAMILQELEFEVVHRPGKTQQHADGLSRNPSPTLKWQAEDWSPSDLDLTPGKALALLADEGDRGCYEAGPDRPADVWEDGELVRWLQLTPEDGDGVPSEAVRGRAQWYTWRESKLWRKLPEGWRVVPKPEEREGLFWLVHRRLGHFGGRRTLQLLRTGYWWHGIQGQVKAWQAECDTCRRARTDLYIAEAELQSLPVRELGYRWSLDILGELPLSRSGKRYVLVMVEHVSKWVEAVAIPAKTSALLAHHFMHLVLSRFGACAEVLTDQGREFQGVFHQLLLSCKIRHRSTSAYHPRTNGLTERAVQTVKRGLRKFAEEEEKKDWDLELPWLLMGYRFSSQESLGVSPYYILYGRQPVLPVGSPVWLEQPLAAEHPDQWLQLCLAKARLFKVMMPTALDNLMAAQDRDARRHAQRMQQARGSGQQVQKGDLVWLKQAKQDTLDVGWSSMKWKVTEVKPSGVVRVQDPHGHAKEVRREQCYRVTPGLGATVVIEGRGPADPKGAHMPPNQATQSRPEQRASGETIVYARRNKRPT